MREDAAVAQEHVYTTLFVFPKRATFDGCTRRALGDDALEPLQCRAGAPLAMFPLKT